MNVRAWTLPASASWLDRATLRLMQRWHGGLRDGVRSFWMVAAVLAAASGGTGLIMTGSGALEAVAGISVVVAFPLGWWLHRRRHPVQIRIHRRAALVGGGLGVFGAVLLRAPVAVLLILVDYGAQAPWRWVIRLLLAGAVAGVGWWFAQQRYRRLVG